MPRYLDVPGPIDMATVLRAAGRRREGDRRGREKGISEVWLNPGAESDALVERARALNIRPIQACSIMAIGKTLTRGET